MSVELKIKQDIPLAPLTTFKIGGSAKFFVEIKNKDELVEAVKWAQENNEKFYVLAGGSNVLINDKGIDGLVIKMANNNIRVRGERLECGAGASLAAAVSLAAPEGLAGLEWAVGIPGTIGGAVRGNAGAFGSSISDITETVEVFNAKKIQFYQFSRKDCEFNYRESVFKQDNNLLVWQAVFKLRAGRTAKIKKGMEECLKRRGGGHPKLPSAGSIFKNVDYDSLRQANAYLAQRAEEDGVVHNNKVPAGWLIDLLGLKGKTIGGAKVSLEHANFIVNTGKATAEDVIMLISYIKQQVRDRFGVQLYEEVQYLGF
jgi:UDP-N-acetylmuramate dehydrogenase